MFYLPYEFIKCKLRVYFRIQNKFIVFVIEMFVELFFYPKIPLKYLTGAGFRSILKRPLFFPVFF